MRITSRPAATVAAIRLGLLRSTRTGLFSREPRPAGGRSGVAPIAQIARGAVAITFATLVGLSGPAHAELVSAVEFYHSDFRHFFLTTTPEEMAKLDAGVFQGWKRAEFEFKVADRPGPGWVPVCRFFSAAFAPKSSHFYTAFPEECSAVKADPTWTFEGEAFYVQLPDATGSCPAGTMPIYRGYNNGAGEAPAHRFTPYRGDQCAYFYNPPGSGCTSEGPAGVAFCAPASLELAQLRTQQFSGTWEFAYTMDGIPTVARFTFGDAVASYPPGLPPRYWPEIPYRAEASGVAAGGGWDPIAGKIVVVFLETMLQFDFDGTDAASGCAYVHFEFFADGRGPCHRLTARRL